MSMNGTAVKYADWVRLLSEDNAHLRSSPARAYWSLAPHYVCQITDCACSLASATMVVNALSGERLREPGSRIVTQQELLAAVNDEVWHKGSGCDGGPGVTLTELAKLLQQGLAAHDLRATITVTPLGAAADAAGAASRLRRDMKACEEGRQLIIANYYSETVIGSGDYGHFSPVAAYDEKQDHVLVMDVWRIEYEPYWVPVEKLVAGMMSTSNAANEPRGYLKIQPDR
jgi:Phytochelatin synthase